jgi:hypothetical protein
LVELERIHIVVKLTGPVPIFRAPDLSDKKERKAARRLAYRPRARIERMKDARGIAYIYEEDDFAREAREIEDVLCAFHDILPIDDDGAVTRIMVALGPYWELTDPNAPTPRVARGVRGFGMGFDRSTEGLSSLHRDVHSVCRAAGLDDYNDDWLVERVLADLLGPAVASVTAELQEYVRHMVIVERRRLRRGRTAA